MLAGDSAALYSNREHFYTRWPLSVHAFIAQITVCTIESTQYSTHAAQEHPTATGPWRGCHRASPAARNQPRRLTGSPWLTRAFHRRCRRAPSPLHHRVMRRAFPRAAHLFDGREPELEEDAHHPVVGLRAARRPTRGLLRARLLACGRRPPQLATPRRKSRVPRVLTRALARKRCSSSSFGGRNEASRTLWRWSVATMRTHHRD